MKSEALIPKRFEIVRELRDATDVRCFLADDKETGQRVVIRDLPQKWFRSGIEARFENEVKLLGQIDCKHYNPLISHDFVADRLRTIYGFCEGIPLSKVIQRDPLSPALAIQLASDLMTAVVAIHRLGCVHRDWLPSHIVMSTSGEAILGGYGPLWRGEFTASDNALGLETVRFTSPELAGIIKHDIGPASDLYSLGLVLYAALTGRPMFDASSVSDLLMQQSTVKMDTTALPPSTPEHLVLLIERLTQKEPRERYQTATAALKDIHSIQDALNGGGNKSSIVIGRSDCRTDLIDPAFVGREAQVQSLHNSLDDVSRGQWKQILLTSPSGMGKSRLIQEFSRNVTRRGFLVLSGDCSSRATQEPNAPWLQIVDQIANFCRSHPVDRIRLMESLADYQQEVVTTMPTLAKVFQWSGGRISGPDELGQGRVVSAFAALMSRLGANGTPVLLSIDNCQWMDDQSIRVLTRLSKSESAYQFLLLSTRPEEGNASRVRDSCRLDKQLHLGPLQDDSIRQLAESMAGTLPNDAVEVVQSYADGSPFMASAVLRGMYESSVLVSKDSEWVLDTEKLKNFQTAEDAADILADRLNSLPETARQFMRAAAVIGNEFTFDAVIALSQVEASDAHQMLADIRKQRMIWSKPNGSYAFVHDKIRDAVLSRIPLDLLCKMHGQTGYYLAKTHPEKAYDLAYHFDAAGMHREALPHALLAAQNARNGFSLGSALFQLQIATRAFHVADSVTRHRIESMMAEVLMLQGDYTEAATWLDACLRTANSQHDEALVAMRRGELAFKRGNKDQAVDLYEFALKQLGESICENRMQLFAKLFVEIGIQALHTALPFTTARRKDGPDETEQLCLKLYSHTAHAYWYTRDKFYTLWAHLRGMNRGEQYAPTSMLAQAYSEHAPAMSLLGWYKRGEKYAKRSLEIRKTLKDIWGQGQSRNFISILHYSASQFDDCVRESTQAVNVLERTGDFWEVHIARYQLAAALYRQGNLEEALNHARANYRSAIQRNDFQGTGNVVEIWARASLGNIPLEVLETELGRDVYDPQRICQVKIAHGVYLYYQERFAEAVSSFSEAIVFAEHASVVNTYVSPAYAWLATAMRCQLETSPPKTASGRKAMLQDVSKAAKRALKVSKQFTNELPHALREYAAVCAINGQDQKAQTYFEKSIASANEQNAKLEHTESVLLHASYGRETGWKIEEQRFKEASQLMSELRLSVGSNEDRGSLSLVDRFDSLLEAGRRIATGTDPDSIRKEVIDASTRLLRGDRVFLVLQQTGGGNMVTQPSKMPFDKGIVKQSEDMRSTVICDLEKIETQKFKHTGTSKHESYGTYLCCPIMVRDQIQAYLYVANSLMMGMYGDDETRIANYLASAAGAALEKADGFARLQELNQTLENKVADRTETLEQRNQEIGRTADRLRAAQKSLRTAKEAAEQANHAKSEFLARMSHEIRTPITAVLGYTELMLRGIVADEAEQQRHLQSIHGNGSHLLNLLNDILDLSKIEADKIEVERISCVPAKVIGDVVTSLQGKAKQKGILLQLRSEGGMPETITCDPTRLRQIVTNLIGNAIKFTAEGGVTVKLGTTLSPESQLPNRICIAIEDTGIGMEPSQLEHIFDPFTQADTSTTRQFGGTGLGLAISKRLAEALGGELSVTSKRGTGSTFQISIAADTVAGDRLLSETEVMELVEGQHHAEWRHVDLAGTKVLLVDDVETNRDLITRFLSDSGVVVTTACNGQEAIDALTDDDGNLCDSVADVVLMDMQMPVLDGYGATAQLCRAGFDTPIIAMTANSMVGDDSKCRTAGCSDYLSKPIDLDALLEMIRTWSTRKAVFESANLPTEQFSASAPVEEINVASAQEVPTLVTPSQNSTTPQLPTDWMREYAVDFVLKVHGKLPELRESYETGDYDEVARQVHWLKGSGGTVGLGELTEIAKSCEQAVHASDLDGILRRIDQIEDYIAQLTPQCEQPLPAEC